MSKSLFPEITVPRSTKEQYRRRVQAVFLRLALRGGEVTPDDVHRITVCPENVNPKNLGIAIFGLAKAGIIAPVRYATSTRACRHNGLYRTWRIADAKMGRAYLTALEKSGDGNASL